MYAKPAPLEERFLDVRGARTRYFVGGDGPPLVLVHGLAGAAANWVELAALLGRRHRLVVPELPGHGGSAPLPAVPNLAAFADRFSASRLTKMRCRRRSSVTPWAASSRCVRHYDIRPR